MLPPTLERRSTVSGANRPRTAFPSLAARAGADPAVNSSRLPTLAQKAQTQAQAQADPQVRAEAAEADPRKVSDAELSAACEAAKGPLADPEGGPVAALMASLSSLPGDKPLDDAGQMNRLGNEILNNARGDKSPHPENRAGVRGSVAVMNRMLANGAGLQETIQAAVSHAQANSPHPLSALELASIMGYACNKAKSIQTPRMPPEQMKQAREKIRMEAALGLLDENSTVEGLKSRVGSYVGNEADEAELRQLFRTLTLGPNHQEGRVLGDPFEFQKNPVGLAAVDHAINQAVAAGMPRREAMLSARKAWAFATGGQPITSFASVQAMNQSYASKASQPALASARSAMRQAMAQGVHPEQAFSSGLQHVRQEFGAGVLTSGHLQQLRQAMSDPSSASLA